MKILEILGYKIGDRFIVTSGDGKIFSLGSVIEYEREYNDDCPLFKLIKGSCPGVFSIKGYCSARLQVKFLEQYKD